MEMQLKPIAGRFKAWANAGLVVFSNPMSHASLVHGVAFMGLPWLRSEP
jgi:hypothetical protein